MLDHLFANVGRVGNGRDPNGAEPLGITDARSLEQQRTFDRPARHDDLARAVEAGRGSGDDRLDRHRALALEQDSLCQRMRDDGEVGPLATALEKGRGRALPFAAPDVMIIIADARPGHGVEVVDPLEPQRGPGIDHGIRQREAEHFRIDRYRPAAPPRRRRATDVILERVERGRHARAVPAARAGRFPGVIIGGLAPAPDHAVDRRRSAQPLAANPHFVGGRAVFARL